MILESDQTQLSTEQCSREEEKTAIYLKHAKWRPYNGGEHPLIQALGLNRYWDPEFCPYPDPHKTINLLATKERVYLMATRDGQVHEITIPYPVTETQSEPEASPYLKPGKHGWDYELHRWSWEGDPDLHTGVGHSVEPEDAERLLREGNSFSAEYYHKHPGWGAHTWPCGCHKIRDEDDSEEE